MSYLECSNSSALSAISSAMSACLANAFSKALPYSAAPENKSDVITWKY